MPNKIFYMRFLDRSISNRRGVWLVLLLSCFIEILVFNANSLDPDQMLPSAVSDLGLGYLSVSHLWDARHKWINKADNLCDIMFPFLHTKSSLKKCLL